jgi:hypothetical protein
MDSTWAEELRGRRWERRGHCVLVAARLRRGNGSRLLCITAQDDGGTGGLESAKQRDEKRGTELWPWRGFELALPAEQGREIKEDDARKTSSAQASRRRCKRKAPEPCDVAFSRAGYVAE